MRVSCRSLPLSLIDNDRKWVIDNAMQGMPIGGRYDVVSSVVVRLSEM
jgi:hypothetical protein